MLSDDELDDIASVIAKNPDAGDIMIGTGGARKVRVAGRGKGKSGGYRVITYFAAEDVPVFLLGALSKGERANISHAERNALKAELSELANDYRTGVSMRIRELKGR